MIIEKIDYRVYKQTLMVELLETYEINEKSLMADLLSEISYSKNMPLKNEDVIKMIQDYKLDPNNNCVPYGYIAMTFMNPKTLKHCIIEKEVDYLIECSYISMLKNFFVNRAKGIYVFYKLLSKLFTTSNSIYIRQIRELDEYMLKLHVETNDVFDSINIKKNKILWDSIYNNFLYKRKMAYMGLLDICVAFYSSGYEFLPPYVILFIIDTFPDNYLSNDNEPVYFTLAEYEKIQLIESVRNYVVKLRNLQSF